MRLGDFWVLDDEPLVQAAWANPAARASRRSAPCGLYGVFNVGGHRGRAQRAAARRPLRRPGLGQRLEVVDGRLAMPGPAVILEFAEPFGATLWRSSLLDVFLQVEAEEG